MNIFSANDQYLLYRYKINKASIVFPDGLYELPIERILSINIEEDYLGSVYPVFSLSLGMEQSLYQKILQYKDQLKFQLDIRKYILKEKADGIEPVHQPYLNQQFSLILDDENNFTNKDVHKLEYPKGDKNEMNALTTALELYLFPPDIVKTNRTSINKIFSKCNVVDAIGRILEEAGVKKNVLMPKVDNIKVYDELVIPPMKLTDGINFISSYYGVFKTGLIYYFGYDATYLLPYCKRSKCLLAKEQEVVTIVIPKMGSAIGDKMCSVKKLGEETPYVIADSSGFIPRSENTTAKALFAEDVDIVDSESGVSASKSKNKGTVIQNFESEFYRDSHKAKMDALQTTMEVTVKDCDLSVFTPNKIYQFVFEDTAMTKKYNGFYHLVKFMQGFTKEEAVLRGGAVCTFHKSLG